MVSPPRDRMKPPPATPGLEFAKVRLLVRDFARSWRFYRDTLGLTAGVGDVRGP